MCYSGSLSLEDFERMILKFSFTSLSIKDIDAWIRFLSCDTGMFSVVEKMHERIEELRKESENG